MKKLLLLVTLMVSIVGVMFAENKADFNTMNGGKTTSSYGSLTSTNKWKTQNCALLSPTNANGELAPTLNGKTTAVGVVTSPVISGGVGTISFDYTNTFKETNGVKLSISIKQDNVEVASTQLENNSVTQNQKYSFSFQFNIAGDFSIEVKNLSPSSNSTSNKDRVSIWNLTWTSYSSGETDEVGVPSITYKDVAVTESQTITEGESIVVNAEKAQKIDIFDETETFASSTTLPYTWTPEFIGTKQITVGATNGTAYEEITFSLTVIEAPKTLGDIFVTYGNGINVENGESDLSVETGTTFSFSARNATNIKVARWSDQIDGENIVYVINVDADNASYTFEEAIEAEGVTIYATDGNEEKTFEFLLTVTEPYVEPINPDAEYVYTLVTTGDDIKAGNEYLIAASVSDRVMAAQASNNRTSVEVEIVDNEIWTLPTDAQVVKLSESTNVAGSYDIQVGETSDGTPQYLYAAGNANANKNQNYLKTTTGTSDSSAAAISIDADNVVKIDFTKASGKQGRYMQYNGVGQSTVFACYTSQHSESGYEHMRLFKKVELPGVPVYDNYADDDTKVAIKIIKGQLHVTVTEYDSEGKEVVPVSTQNKASYASTSDWTNPVTVDENGMYLIELPKISGNYIKIQAKNELNGYHSEELVKNVDASGNVISGVEGVVADDANAPVEYFNLQGVRVAADQPGLYIRRQGSKVEKVSIAR